MVDTFGTGGGEPYARALRNDGPLLLVAADRPANETVLLDVARWNSAADATDMSLIEEGDGPLLDIGCGPGRMVKAALTAGYDALGVDVSPVAVAIASDAGLPVLHQSVFDSLPREGEWMTLLLVDGNIGIGGDPSALLARCHELMAPAGCVLVEVSSDPLRDQSCDCTVIDAEGHASASFPWATIGRVPLQRRAKEIGFRTVQSWTRDSRTFVRLMNATEATHSAAVTTAMATQSSRSCSP